MPTSMRPFAANDVATVADVTRRFARVHGAPLHIGDPNTLGIADITRPDFGELLLPLLGEVPMYWGCGLTAISGVFLDTWDQPGVEAAPVSGNKWTLTLAAGKGANVRCIH